ncbi:MAG: DUF4162 domain-containing protein, partial [Planctomycetota bacterium]|nr:DUF4162 domain-containing protein [Planctomycetota bacterium]
NRVQNDKIRAIPGVTALERRDDTLRFVLSGTVAENASTLQHALEAVTSYGMRVEDLHVHRPTLEDVFIRLTGKRLRDEDGS